MTPEIEPSEEVGPECDLCGKADCPDANLPGFSEPRDCVLTPVYEQLRYDRCDYGCGRDITKAAIRRAARVMSELLQTPGAPGGYGDRCLGCGQRLRDGQDCRTCVPQMPGSPSAQESR